MSTKRNMRAASPCSFIAAQQGHLAVVPYLVKELGAHVNNTGIGGPTPLLIAAQHGHLAVVRCLVKELGANVNHATNDGATPLFFAAQTGNKEMVVCLVEECGADLNQATKFGATPLMIASGEKHEKIVRYLLKKGAKSQASHEEFGTAADVSRFRGGSKEQTTYLEARTHCAKPGCGGAGLKKCAGCLQVYFCSRDCQVAHWPVHKADCKRRVEVKADKEK